MDRTNFLHLLLASVPSITAPRRLLLAQTLDNDPSIPAAGIEDFDQVTWCCRVAVFAELARYRSKPGARLRAVELAFRSEHEGAVEAEFALFRGDSDDRVYHKRLASCDAFAFIPDMRQQIKVPAYGELAAVATTTQEGVWCCGVMFFDLE